MFCINADFYWPPIPALGWMSDNNCETSWKG